MTDRADLVSLAVLALRVELNIAASSDVRLDVRGICERAAAIAALPDEGETIGDNEPLTALFTKALERRGLLPSTHGGPSEYPDGAGPAAWHHVAEREALSDGRVQFVDRIDGAAGVVVAAAQHADQVHGDPPSFGGTNETLRPGCDTHPGRGRSAPAVESVPSGLPDPRHHPPG